MSDVSIVAAIAAASTGRLLTGEEEQQLGRLTQAGDTAARNLLVERNQGLVWSIAKHYRDMGVEVEDLVSFGNFGLIHAADAFDPDRGLKFSTFAHFWVRQAITRAIGDHSRLVRVPIHMHERLRLLGRAEGELSSEVGRAPTDEEVAERMGLSLDQLARAREAARYADTLSLDAQADRWNPDSDARGDLTPDPTALVEAAAERAVAAQEVAELLEALSPRLAKVLRLRYGLDGHGKNRTLGTVGSVLGITRERVRQLEAEALTQLRRRLSATAAAD